MINTARTVRLKNIYPVAAVFGKVCVNRRGWLTIGYEVTLPTADSLNEKEYDDMHDHFTAAVCALPEYTLVHRQDWYTWNGWRPDEEEGCERTFLKEAYDRHFLGRRYLRHRCYIFLTMGSRGLMERPSKASGIFGLGSSTKIPSPQEFQYFEASAEKFVSSLTVGGYVSVRTLTEEDWLGDGESHGIVQQAMMLGDDGPITSDIHLTPSTVSVRDKYLQCYTLGDSDYLPGMLSTTSRQEKLSTLNTDVFLSGASPIGIGLNCEHVVNFYCFMPSQPELRRQLESERKKMYSGALQSSDNRIFGEEIQSFLDDCVTMNRLLVSCHCNVMAWSAKEEAMAVSNAVSNALKAIGCTAVYNNLDTPILWYAAVPGNGPDLGKTNLMTMEIGSATCLVPQETFERSDRRGQIRLCDRHRNVPVLIDMQNPRLVPNRNIFILGGSGTGKSFTTNKLVNELYNRGQSIFIIDVGGSYEIQCALIRESSGGRDGQYYEWSQSRPLQFNGLIGWRYWLDDNGNLKQVTDDALDSDDDSDESLRKLAAANNINFFISFLQTVWEPQGGWTSARTPILRQTIVDYIKWEKEHRTDGSQPVLDDYYRFLARTVRPAIIAGAYRVGEIDVDSRRFAIDDFLIALKAYAKDGEYWFLMNAEHPDDIFSSRFTVFEVDALAQVSDKKFYALCLLCIVNSFDNKMRGSRSDKVMIIEEAWKAISNETMEPYLRGLWKTARKFNTAACIVTQEAADITSSPVIKTAILDNSPTRILLDQSNHLNDFDGLKDMLSLTDKDASLILSINRDNNPNVPFYKEVYINLGGRRSGVFAVEVSEEEAVAYESNKDIKGPWLERARRLGSTRAMIEELVQQRREEKRKH